MARSGATTPGCSRGRRAAPGPDKKKGPRAVAGVTEEPRSPGTLQAHRAWVSARLEQAGPERALHEGPVGSQHARVVDAHARGEQLLQLPARRHTRHDLAVTL